MPFTIPHKMDENTSLTQVRKIKQTHCNGFHLSKDKRENTILGLHAVKKYFHIHRSYTKWSKYHLFHLDSPFIAECNKIPFEFSFHTEEKNKKIKTHFHLLAWNRLSSSHAHPSLFWRYSLLLRHQLCMCWRKIITVFFKLLLFNM